MGQDKGSSTEAKQQGGGIREITHHLPQANQCPASLRAAATLEGTWKHLSALLPLLPIFMAEHNTV